MSRRIVGLAVLIVAIALAGTLFWEFVLNEHPDAILTVTSFTVAMIAFFGFMRMSGSPDGESSLTMGAMRNAIAGSIVVTYLYVVSVFVYVGYIGDLPEIVRLLLDSLTAAVSVTIAFYLGSEAAIRIFSREASAERESSAKNEST